MAIPPDPVAAPIFDGPCRPWTTVAAVRARCTPPLSTADYPDPAVQVSIDLASLVLWAASGRKYGLCQRTYRPCYGGNHSGPREATWRSSEYPPSLIPMTVWGIPVYGPQPWGVYPGPGCGCSLPELYLPGPIAHVDHVMIDGQALPAAAYGIVTHGPRARASLVRIDGNSWPCCQDLLRDPLVLPAELGSCPAWQVTYWQGRPVDSIAAEAAAILAEQFVKSLCGGPCDDRLVPGLTRVSRRGVTREFTPADMRDPQTGQTRTGLPLVDAWIAAVNPHRRARAALLVRADDPTRRQLWSWVDGTAPLVPVANVPMAPLFIPDNGTGTVTGNGQIVYAGAGVTINVAPGVTWFQPVSWASQTPWALGSTPVIVRAGTTTHPTSAAELLEGAGGDLLVVALDGTVWHVAGANTGGGPATTGAQEILATAGEALSALRVVTLGVDGLVHLFEPTAANAGLVLGVTRTAAAVGQQVAVVTSGTLDGATGLVAGTPYYAGPNGTLVATRPLTGLLVAIGYEGDNDTFVVQVSDSVELA